MRPILQISNKNNTSQHIANLIAERMDLIVLEIGLSDLNNINTLIEEKDAALLVIGLNSNKEIQFYLNKCRELRVPYIFVNNDIPANFDIKNIILPITNLEEDREKGPFSSSFARHFNCPITIYQPNDYGSKAETNIEAMKNLFNSLNLQYSTQKGKKDSNGIELESAILNKNNQNSILIISASRDYGLDDIIFGPKERKIIKNTNIPTMLINPRGDLYTLCD
jgi:glutaredoxin